MLRYFLSSKYSKCNIWRSLFSELDNYWRQDCEYAMIQNISEPLLRVVERREFGDAFRKYIPDISLQGRLYCDLRYTLLSLSPTRG